MILLMRRMCAMIMMSGVDELWDRLISEAGDVSVM